MNPRDDGRRGRQDFGQGRGDDDREPQQGDWYTGGNRHLEQRHFGVGQQGGYGGQQGGHGSYGEGQQGGWRGDNEAGWRGRPGSQEHRGRQEGPAQATRSDLEADFTHGSRGAYDPGGTDLLRPTSRGGRDDRDQHQPGWTDGQDSGQSRNAQHFDPEYHQWRTEQMRTLDADYRAWRQERYKKFSDEFNTWRSSRNATGSSGTAAAAGTEAGGTPEATPLDKPK